MMEFFLNLPCWIKVGSVFLFIVGATLLIWALRRIDLHLVAEQRRAKEKPADEG